MLKSSINLFKAMLVCFDAVEPVSVTSHVKYIEPQQGPYRRYNVSEDIEVNFQFDSG